MSINLSIKNVPNELAERLRQRAKINHRSLQGEVMSILENAAYESVLSTGRGTLTIEEAVEQIKKLSLKSEKNEAEALIRQMRDERDDR